MQTEQGFREFTFAELDVGYHYALSACGVRVDFATLRIAGNHAGTIRKAKGVTPRVAAVEALRAYEKRNHVGIAHNRFEAYIRSIAKMMSERNPKTVIKRNRERVLADIQAAS